MRAVSVGNHWPREVVIKHESEHASEYIEGLLKPWAPPQDF